MKEQVSVISFQWNRFLEMIVFQIRESLVVEVVSTYFKDMHMRWTFCFLLWIQLTVIQINGDTNDQGLITF